MSKSYELKADKRENAGKGVARALRRENKVPAVIYGDGKAPVSISLTAKDVNLEYLKGHMFTYLCNLDVSGQKNLVLARDVQLHPVKDTVQHVDFLRVTAKTRLDVFVPVHFINEEECPGIQQEKGVLNANIHEIELNCAATDIPEFIEVDLKDLKLDDTITLAQLKLPAGAKPVMDDPDFVVAAIHEPREYVEPTPETEGETAAEGAEGAEGAAAAEGEKAEEGKDE